MTNYLANSFSLNMLEIGEKGVSLQIIPVKPEDVPVDAISIIGHPDTAASVSNLLGRPVFSNRITVTLNAKDVLYVVQYFGPRLEIDAKRLPKDARMEFYCIKQKNHK